MLLFVKSSEQHLVSVSSFTPPLAGSWSFWLTRTAEQSGDVVGLNDATYRILLGQAGALSGVLRRKSNQYTTTTVNLSLNTQYHVVVTYSDVSGNTTVAIYLDGALNISESKQDGTPTAGSLYLGSYSNKFYFLDARLEDVRHYDRVLSLAEIETIHACRGVDFIRAGLTNRWLTNEGPEGGVASGTGSIKDEVGALNMTPVNSPTFAGSRLKWRRLSL